MNTTQYFAGKGKFYIAPFDGGALVDIGQVEKLVINVSEDKQDLMNYETAGGGVVASISRIKSASLAITADAFTAENLAAALRGTTTTNSSVTVITGETQTAYKGGLIVLDRIPNATKNLTVTDSSSPLEEGTDYIRTGSGIALLSTGSVVNGDTLTFSYTPVAEETIETLSTSQQYFRMYFEGLNEVASGAPVLCDFFRVLMSPTKGVDLISDKFGNLTLDGTIMKDASKTGMGESQYFKIRQQVVA